MKKRVDLKNTEKAVKSKTGSFEKKRQIQFLQHLKRRLKKKPMPNTPSSTPPEEGEHCNAYSSPPAKQTKNSAPRGGGGRGG